MADGEKLTQDGGQAGERNLVGSVGRSLGRIFVGLEKNTVGPGRDRGGREHGCEFAVPGGAIAAAARTLHGMGGVEDQGEALGADPRDGAHVGHEVIVAEGCAALGEEEAAAAHGTEFARDGFDFAGREELALLHVDGTAAGSRGGDQIGLTAEEGGDLQEVDMACGDGDFFRLVDVGGDVQAEVAADGGENAAAFLEARAAEGGS